MIYNNILETIGRTPLVRINKLVGKGDATLIAKLESFNPCGSVKDRTFHDRGGRKRWFIETWNDYCGTDLGEHGDRLSYGGGGEGI